MEYLILSALTGLIVGIASTMFSSTRNIKPRIVNIVTAVCGGILLGSAGNLLHLSLPTPALALAGSVAAIIILIMFRKPSIENRSYYM